ncbi:MAG: hypothetical protein AAGJ35_15060, partial [Myxococcota bacterium]
PAHIINDPTDPIVHPCGDESPETITRLAMMAPDKLRNSLPPGMKFRLIWDTAASLPICPNKSEFIGTIKPCRATHLTGVGSKRIEGIGHVAWKVMDVNGQLRTIVVPAYDVPDVNVCCCR